MKALRTFARRSTPFSHPAVLRAALALGSLVSFVLASGAGNHWH